MKNLNICIYIKWSNLFFDKKSFWMRKIYSQVFFIFFMFSIQFGNICYNRIIKHKNLNILQFKIFTSSQYEIISEKKKKRKQYRNFTNWFHYFEMIFCQYIVQSENYAVFDKKIYRIFEIVYLLRTLRRGYERWSRNLRWHFSAISIAISIIYLKRIITNIHGSVSWELGEWILWMA